MGVGSETAPLWICFLPQLTSVLGDSLGQRCNRVCHHRARRRFVLALVAVSTFQMLLVLSIIQLALPKTTTVLYLKHSNGTVYDYCAQPENTGNEWCFSQGPLTIYRALDLCPALLLDQVLNIVYYIGEACFYRESLGLVFLVLSALASSFLIAPIQLWMNLSHGKAPSALPIVFGIVGSIFCLVERTPAERPRAVSAEGESPAAVGKEERTPSDIASTAGSLQAVAGAMADGDNERSPLQTGSSTQHRSRLAVICSKVLAHLPLLGPFTMLSAAYAVYFVLMDYYDERCKVNLWGYNAFDQVMLPVFIYPFFALADLVRPVRHLFVSDGELHETFWEAVKGAARELFGNRGKGFWTMFAYRGLINARAMAYTYIAIVYDLSTSYLQLTLIRVGLSWVVALLLVLLVPKLIEADEGEQRRLKDPVNICLKVVGTGAIVASLIVLNHK